MRLKVKIAKQFVVAILLVCLCGWVAPAAQGQQLSDEMREIYNEMLPRLNKDLKQKVLEALELERDYLELTPDQFKRFRDHPANPFEGWDGIDPDSIDGIIRLQFETQPIRSREAGKYERQSPNLLRQNQSTVAQADLSTVVVTNGKVQIALGIVVTPDGHVLTKLSEIEEHEKLFCKSTNQKSWKVEIVERNQRHDVAILKIPAGALPVAQFATSQPEIGAFMFSTNAQGVPMAMGVYSNPPRSLIGKNQAFLGVKPVDDTAGIKVVEVTHNSSAQEAGLLIGDILTEINGVRLESVQSLVNEIRKNEPGDSVVVGFRREGVERQATAILAGRNVGGPTADRFRQMNTFGVIQSERRDEFPLVFQHDTPLVPEQCGGPVVNLDGQVIGMNIARGGRVASYAIPADHLQLLVREMLRTNVASNDSGNEGK